MVWFDDRIADKLMAAEIGSPGEFAVRIAAGGHWDRTLPAVGTVKAQRIAQHLATLLPATAQPSLAATAKAHQREATRQWPWLQHERQRRLAQMDVADRTASLAFLQHVPERWISRPRWGTPASRRRRLWTRSSGRRR